MPMSDTQLAQARGFLADPGTSAIQQINIANADSGTYTISFNSQTTAAIPAFAGANVVQNALSALSTIGLGNIGVNTNPQTPLNMVYALYFGGTLGALAQNMVTVDISGLTPISGLTVTVEVTQTQAGGVTAFTDDELNGLYDQQASQNYFLAIAFAFDWLTADAAKFNQYTAGQTQERKDQIYTHLKERAAWAHQWANAYAQVQFVTMRAAPPLPRAVPVVSGVPAVGLQYTGGPFGGPWGRSRNRGWW